MPIDLNHRSKPRAESYPQGGAVLPLLLGEMSLERFFDKHFGTEPLLAKGAGRWAMGLASVAVCERLVADPGVDLLFARDGQPFGGARLDLEGARRLFASGHSWVLRDVDRLDPPLAELGRTLATELHGSLHLQLHRTPAAHFGFGWHFDPEEVFYLQAVGRKKVCLRQNTQHPHPIGEKMPTWLSANNERTPMIEYVLEPGDCLYIPSGWWHLAAALTDTVAISAGVRAPSACDALTLVIEELVHDPRWRRRLEPMGRANPKTELERQQLWHKALGELGAELQRRLSAPVLPTRLFALTGWWKQSRPHG